jgi:hypothetical protein
MFEKGLSPVQTTIAPIITCASTPATSTKDMAIKSRRFGLSRTDNKTHKITDAATTPVKSRFSCSIAACTEETSMNLLSLHCGQSAQPRPDPVSLTREPVTMIR